MNGATAKKLRRLVREKFGNNLRVSWAALAQLPARDRLRLAWWMAIGKRELPR